MAKVSQITHEGELVETALVKIDPIVVPAVSSTDAIAAWGAYQQLKKDVATKEDFQSIKGKDFPKKSLWRKLATFFNLSVELVSEKENKNEDGSIDFDVIYKAIAPNGRSVVGDGSCNSHEKMDRDGRVLVNSRHNTRGTANTRAFNRAVSNLIGGGEVSAEEIRAEDVEDQIPFQDVFKLLEELNISLLEADTYTRFQKLTGKLSFSTWTYEDGEKVLKALKQLLKTKEGAK